MKRFAFVICLLVVAGTGLVSIGKAATKPTGLEFRHLICVRDQAHPHALYKMDFKRDKAGKETIVFEDAHGKPVTESQVIKRSKLVLGSTDVKPVSKMITDPMAQEPTITVEMTISGKKKLADFTRRNEGEILAIIVNGKIISAPTVEEPIKNGSVVIRGLFSKQEAQRIADAINAGASSNK